MSEHVDTLRSVREALTNAQHITAYCNALDAAIQALTPAPAGDWVMVPREPTADMLYAGMEASPMYPLTGTGKRVGIDTADAGQIYAAMLAAAPQPAQPTPAGDWVMVPREPTDEIVWAGRDAWHAAIEAMTRKENPENRNPMTEAYAAMLAAAPQQAQPTPAPTMHYTNGVFHSKVSDEQVEAVIGPIVDRIRATYPTEPAPGEGLPPSCGPAENLNNATLVNVALQSAGRNALYCNKVQHDRLFECKDELLRRLAHAQQHRAGVDDAVIGAAFLKVLRDPSVSWRLKPDAQLFIDRVADTAALGAKP